MITPPCAGAVNANIAPLASERLKLLRKKQKSDRAALKQEILKGNPPPKALTPEEKDRRWREIFGISPDTHPMLHGRQWNQQPDPAHLFLILILLLILIFQRNFLLTPWD